MKTQSTHTQSPGADSDHQKEKSVRGGTGLLLAMVGFLSVLGITALLMFLTGKGPDMRWMAWTRPTGVFFGTIACLLLAMSVWEVFRPGGGPRVGILRFETTRGDRLFLSLLGSAFIHLAWLALVSDNLWQALGVSLVYAALVFTLV